MGTRGNDTAIEASDIQNLTEDLMILPTIFNLSMRTKRIIRQNIMIALGLKIIALLLIIPGLLTMWIAIISDVGATLLVTLNSFRLIGPKSSDNKQSN